MQRPGQRRAQTRYIQMGILPGLFLFKHPTTSSVSPCPPPPSSSFRSSEIYNESITMHHQRRPLPKILTVSVTAALPIRRDEKGGGDPDATRILGSMGCLRSSADLFKGFDLSFRSLPQKTVAQIRYWLITKSFNGFCRSADKRESRI